ncbi:MAG: 1-deoxy-D-xylulose-5-phosphate synthase, partial [Halanaerobium sp. MSAO_Bac5]
TMSTGLAKGGLKAVCAIYSTFLQRAYDQVIHDVAIQNVDLTLALDRAGIVGNDGETHQGVFDFSFLRPIPNLVLMAPKDADQLQDMLYTAVNYQGPAVLRYPRGSVNGNYEPKEFKEIEIGRAEELIAVKAETKLTIIAVGSTVYPAQKAAEILNNNGYQTALIDSRFVKPLDEEMILKAAAGSENILIVEEQVLAGGFSSAILELLNDKELKKPKIKRLGISDQFVTQGEMAEKRAEYDLDGRGILKNALQMLDQNREAKSLWPKKND